MAISMYGATALADEQGGSGRVFAQGLELPTASRLVPTVQFNYQLRYKFTSLMGEPVANFGLSWSVFSIDIDAGNGNRSRLLMWNAPESIRKAAEHLDLMLSGTLELTGNSAHRRIWVDFDTGAPVHPAAFMGSLDKAPVSWNVPGSPNWDDWMHTTNDCGERGKRDALPAADAKAIYKAGIKKIDMINGNHCRGSVLGNTEALEAAIVRLCKDNKSPYDFCPKKTEKDKPDAKKTASDEDRRREDLLDGPAKATRGSSDIASALDEAAERPQVERKLAEEVAKYRASAVKACAADMDKIEACFAHEGCTPKALPPGITPAQCDGIPSYPTPAFRGLVLTRVYADRTTCENYGYDSYECQLSCENDRRSDECRNFAAQRDEAIAAKREDARRASEALEQQRRDWTARYGALAESCKPYTERKSMVQTCRKERESSCNPGKATADSCLAERMRSAPTMNDARALMQKEWARKAQDGKRTPADNNKSPKFFD